MDADNCTRVGGEMQALTVPETAVIAMTRCQSAIVDKSDECLVLSFASNWRMNAKGYASSTKYDGRIAGVTLMHRLILGFPLGMIDHKNRNKLDNRRDNLRLATGSQNQANKPRQSTKKTSRFKGVFFQGNTGLWEARICCNKKRMYLGAAETEEDAARLYDAAALRCFGEFACTIFQDN